MTVAARKIALRAEMRARRAGLDAASAGAALAVHVMAAWRHPAQAIVAGTWPLPGEIDLRPLLIALHAHGHAIVLPQTPPPGQALIFRRWHPGCSMLRERFGTWRPDGAEAVPDIIFVPLLAFDRCCHRLGFGGGYYDRTLSALPGALAVGAGFALQEVADIPVEPHDRTLDAVATESGLLRCSSARTPFWR